MIPIVLLPLELKVFGGSGDWQMVTGLEYLTSAKYKGVYRDDNSHATSEIDLNGVYFNVGLRYSF